MRVTRTMFAKCVREVKLVTERTDKLAVSVLGSVQRVGDDRYRWFRRAVARGRGLHHVLPVRCLRESLRIRNSHENGLDSVEVLFQEWRSRTSELFGITWGLPDVEGMTAFCSAEGVTFETLGIAFWAWPLVDCQSGYSTNITAVLPVMCVTTTRFEPWSVEVPIATPSAFEVAPMQ